MYYLLKKHLIYDDNYFLYKKFENKNDLLKYIEPFINKDNIKVIEGNILDIKVDINIQEQRPKDEKD